MEINGRSVSIISEAVGGTNVDNCPHACSTKPCGPLAQCIPNLENYECQCNKTNLQCNKAEELSLPSNNNSSVDERSKSAVVTASAPITATPTTASSIVHKVFNKTTKAIASKRDGKQDKQDYTSDSISSLSKSSATVVYSSDLSTNGNGITVKDQDDDKRNYNKNTNSDNIDGDTYDYYYDDDDDDADEYKNDDLRDITGNSVKATSTENKQNATDVNLKIATTTVSSSTPTTTTTTTTTTTAATSTTDKPLSTASPVTSSSGSSNGGSDSINDENDDDLVVTRVFGRYMTVDTQKLLKKEEMLKSKKAKEKQAKKSKPLKKHYIPMPLLKPQPPSLVNDEVEVDIVLPTSKSEPTTTVKDDDNQQTLATDDNGKNHDEIDDEFDAMGFYSNEDVLTTKELIDDMARIMKNGAEIRRNQMNRKTKYLRKGHGACFTGAGSYFHYNDAETMRQIISYKIDLNLRIKTHSHNGKFSLRCETILKFF